MLAATIAWSRIGEPFKGYDTAETVRRDPARRWSGRDQKAARGRGGHRRRATRSARRCGGVARPAASRPGNTGSTEPMSAVEVIQKIGRGDIYTRRITFPEGLTIPEMAALYESRGFGSAQSFIAAASDESAIAQLDPQAPDLEGYLFPETYALAARRSRVAARQADGRSLSQHLHRRPAAEGRDAGADDAAGRDAGVARREGNRERGGTTRWSRRCIATACASACRCRRTRP